MLYFIIWRTTYSFLSEILNFVSLIITFVFANIIVYKGLNYPEVLSGIESKQLTKKYEKSLLLKSDKERYLKKLIFYMEKEKPYLMPSLTIDELADRLSIPSRQLSQVINESLNRNFFDFVNSYRIEEIKRILLDPLSDKKTILEMLFEAGFNSKAAFNRAFKKHAGMNPTEFRKNHQI